MKNLLRVLVLVVLLSAGAVSCTTVTSGHKGVEVSYGGATNMEVVHPEGLLTGFKWIYTDIVEYDVREHTLVKKYSFNDSKDMLTTVTVALDYNLSALEVNKLHKGINDVDTKIETSLSSGCKEVVPQHTAVDLNKHARAEAEATLAAILKKELPEFFVTFKRVRITDVDFPKSISDLAAQTATQIGKNELASKMEQEEKFKANAKKAAAQGVADAKVIKSQGDLDAAKNDSKTRDLLSSTKMLELQKVENERIMAEGFKEHGKSFYGTNNIFGSDAAAIIKGLK